MCIVASRGLETALSEQQTQQFLFLQLQSGKAAQSLALQELSIQASGSVQDVKRMKAFTAK